MHAPNSSPYAVAHLKRRVGCPLLRLLDRNIQLAERVETEFRIERALLCAIMGGHMGIQ